jgi:hypothetical protein
LRLQFKARSHNFHVELILAGFQVEYSRKLRITAAVRAARYRSRSMAISNVVAR